MQIRRGKIPRSRELSRLGCEAEPGRLAPVQWMTHYLSHGRNAAFTCRHFGISRQTFYRWWRRYDPQNLAQLGGSFASPASTSPAHLDGVTGRSRSRSATRVPPLGKGQTRHPAPPSKSQAVHLHGRTDPERSGKRGVLLEPPRPAVSARRRKLRHRPWATRKPRFWPFGSRAIWSRSIPNNSARPAA